MGVPYTGANNVLAACHNLGSVFLHLNSRLVLRHPLKDESSRIEPLFAYDPFSEV
jgi:hypothetical protein